ncbi:MAG TPA: DUF4431 domain-containing protein [Armatimonadetes bacterium]|nr:DUF4431 domain-containing protein [Armatimonadota bacterium]
MGTVQGSLFHWLTAHHSTPSMP